MSVRKILNSAGDTIVEVMFAVAVIGALLAGAYAATTRSLSTVQSSQERDTAIQASETQIEMLQSLYGNNSSYQKTINSYLQKGYEFCIDNSATPPKLVIYSNTSPNCAFNSNGIKASAPSALTYSIIMKGDSHVSNQVDLLTSWNGSNGTQDSLPMYVRLLQPVSIDTQPCPPGYTGSPPKCTQPCPPGFIGTSEPNCVAPCPHGDTGTPPNCVAPCTSGSETFTYTGSGQQWNLPNMASSCNVSITVAGADGGNPVQYYGSCGSTTGGYGAQFTLTLPEQSLANAMNGVPMQIYVGQRGGNGSNSTTFGGGGGGGGYYRGQYYSIGGAGGGASWIIINGSIAAGAGGGGGGYCGSWGQNGGGGPYSSSTSSCYSFNYAGYTWEPCNGGEGGQTPGGVGGICEASSGCVTGQSGLAGTATQGGSGGNAGSVYGGDCNGGAGGGGGGSVVRAGGGGGGSNAIFFPYYCDWGSGGGGGGGANMVSGSIPWSKTNNTTNTGGNGFVTISWK